MNKIVLIVPLLSLFFITAIFGQKSVKKTTKKAMPVVEKQSEIYNEIFQVDSAMFYAFNNCDSIGYRKFLADDLEFYHDLGGLHFLAEEMQSIKEMCGRQSHIRRELTKGTLEVYKLGDYGAVEIGIHRIYHTSKGESEHISGDYKFVHVWHKKDSVWKLSRIISYGHNKMNNN